MKTLLSLLFYIFMAGTTATVGTGLGDALPNGAAATLLKNSGVESRSVKEAAPSLKIVKEPITFKAFGARNGSEGAVITWASSPAPEASFLVEKSSDGKTFTTVASIQPSAEEAHKFCDVTNTSGAGFYRVQAIAAGSEPVYSAQRKVKAAR